MVTYSVSSVTMDNSGGSVTIGLSCLGDWEVDYCPAWITLSANSGSGNSTLTITPDVNTGDTREGFIVINGYSLPVTQRLAEATITPSMITIPNSGGSQNISITCDGGWTLTVPEWAEANAYSGNGNSVVTISSSGINTGGTIIGFVTVNGAECRVRQEGGFVIDWLTLTFISSGTFTKNSFTCDYKLNDGEWIGKSGSLTLNVSSGDVLQLRAERSESNYYTIGGTALCRISGNPLSMCYGSGFTGQTVNTSTRGLMGLFIDYNGVVDASDMVVPVADLSSFFQGCTNLVTPPSAFPATVVDAGYMSMFERCTSLTGFTATLPTTLADFCYAGMFEKCSGLTVAPSLPATALTEGCYEGMFAYCSGLTSAPSLPATTLAERCYKEMFRGCTGLTTAPDLPAATLMEDSYWRMFRGCTSLQSIKCLATNISASGCTTSWVNGVAASGTFTKASAMTGWTTGDDGIPSGWTVQNE